jgi:hypothetical protein
MLTAHRRRAQDGAAGDAQGRTLQYTAPREASSSCRTTAGPEHTTFFHMEAQMATEYTINLTIPRPTIQELVAGKFSLYGFKAVQSGITDGAPLVWFATRNYLEQNRLVWTEQYEAYLAEDTELAPGTQIFASSSTAIELHQRVKATDAGLGKPEQSGEPGIIIDSRATKNFLCGLTLHPPKGTGTDSPNPLCAFKLLPSTLIEMLPIERVVLLFATGVINTGTVFEQSQTHAVLIDLTVSNPMPVTFDLSVPGGWVEAPGVTPQEPPVDLISLVIPTNTSLRAGRK